MTYYGGKDLAAAFRTVRKNTLAIAEEIPEDQYGFLAAAGTRTVAQILVHISQISKLAEQIHAVERRSTLEGFDFPGFIQRLTAEEGVSRTKAQIVELLREGGDRFAAWLDGLSGEFLGESVAMPAGMPPKSRFEMLLSVKEHEMHHRGQLMLIGIVPHLTREMQARFAAAAKPGA